MEGLMWKCVAIMLIALCSMTLAVPVPQVESVDALNPIAAEENNIATDLDREKRKLPEATFGAKNAILGYVFGNGDYSDDSQRIHERVTRATPVLPPGTTDDTPDFNRDMVMLDIPDQLFGSSFSMVSNISKIFGDVISNSARRYGQFVQYFKPLLGKALVVKGIYPPPPTTTTTESSTSTTESSTSTTDSNDV